MAEDYLAASGVVLPVVVAFEEILSALEFYASPDTYHAIAIWPDPPCGEFMDDYSEHGDSIYPPGDQRPGKRAREALRAWIQAVRPEVE
jgi:hypothetical protein